MKQLANNILRSALTMALLVGMVFVAPNELQAKPRANITVDITVTVHGSDIGVSSEVIDDAVEKLLEAGEIKVIEEGAGEGIVELQIDIYKNDGGGFRVACDWDEDDQVEAEKRADTQDQIDDMVEDMVDTFIEFIHKG